MASVDNRVVAMQFDNAAFERKISDTIKSLGALKQSLDFSNSSRGLSDIARAADSFNISGIASAVDTISQKFTAMGAIAFSVIQNITTQALGLASRVASSFTISPVTSGFKEYETNINSIQTILSNTKKAGTNLDDVTAALDQLNVYSDQTIYNFGEMARNIGTFTAAGVDLDTSVNAIKGIANLAALSGSSAQQAATAMYQLSQAIAAGRVSLMDWNSVTNAGIGGEVFKNSLFETAKALGTIEGITIDTTFEEWEAAGNMFRQSLSGTGVAIDAEATAVEAATTKGLKALEEANTRAAEAAENASERVVDAQVNVIETAKDTAEAVANAEKQRSESAEQNSKAIINAEKAQIDVFEQTANAIEAAVKEQSDSVKEGAENVKNALDGVVDAQKRLEEALKPASTDQLGAATDRLATAQLDQADLANAVTDAQRDQARAADDLSKAQRRLRELQQAPVPDFDAINSAYNQVEDAQRRVLDLADAQQRAQISQNGAARDLTAAEEELAKIKLKGTEADEAVIEARSALEIATDRLVEVQEAASKRQEDAVENLARVQIDSEERRAASIEATAFAKEKATEDEIRYNKDLADAVENSAKRQQDAAKSLADAEKSKARTLEDNLALIERARADAEAAVDAAAEASGEAPSWLTSEVLTTALSAFTGDLTEAQLMALGYTEAQAKEMIELGKLGQDAATTVKTLSQLLGTVKESIGSGWSQSFRIIFGDFEEAKGLFTDLNNSIGEIISTSADGRNALLNGWSDLGGRTALIEGLGNAFEALTSFLKPIREAFRDIFPKQTAESLLALTERFRDFTASLKIGGETADLIKRIFRGVFAAFEIGVTILKGVASFFKNIFDTLADGAGGPFLEFFAQIGDAFVGLNDILVNDGGIQRFFDGLSTSVGNFLGNIGQFITDIAGFSGGIAALFESFKLGLDGVIDQEAQGLLTFVNDLGLAISGLWDKLFGGDTSDSVVGEGVDRLSERLSLLESVGKTLGDMWDALTSKTGIFGAVLTELGNFLSDAFDEIKNSIAGAFDEESFDETLDLINTGLFAGLVALIGKFVTTGLKIDFGANLAKNLSEGLGKLTDVLGAMQANLRASALQKIAVAILVLAGALFILATIDSGDLTKALAAIAVGFGQLVGTMAVLAQISTGKQSVGLAALGAAMILLASAAVILAGALKLIGTMDPDELATGLAGLTGIFTGMGLAAKLLQGTGPSLVVAGTGMIAVAGATVILALALRLLSTLSIGEIVAGLVTMGAALLIIAGAMALMPPTLPLIGAGLILVSVGLSLLSVAILAFAAIDLEAIGKGLLGITAALIVIAFGMSLMPLTLPLTAAGLVLVSIALTAIVASIALLGGISWEALAKGIGGIAAILFVLAVAAAAMSGSILGAIAIGIMAVSLLALTAVLRGLATLSIKELAIGLGAIAASLIVFGVAASLLTPLIPSLLGLGAALFLIGGAFALFGVGAALVAQAFAVLATVSGAAIGNIIEAIGQLITALPTFVKTFVEGILEIADVLLDAAPELSKKFFELLTVLIKDLVKILPELGKALIEIIDTAVTVITAQAPKIIALGFFLINEFLTQLRANLPDIVQTGIDIITSFIDGVTQRIPDLIKSGSDFIIAFLKGMTEKVGEIVSAGADLLIALLEGIAEQLDDVIVAGGKVTIALIEGIGKNAINIVTAAVGLVISFITAIGEQIDDIVSAGAGLVVGILEGIAEGTEDIVIAAVNVVIYIFNALVENTWRMTDAGTDLLIAVLNAIGDDVKDIATAASNLVIRVTNALMGNLTRMKDAGVDLLIALLGGLDDDIIEIADAVFVFITNVLNGLADVIDQRSGELRDAGWNIATAIADGMSFGLASKVGGFVGGAVGFAGKGVSAVTGFLGINSPSKVFMKIGEGIGEGFILGMRNEEGNVVKASTHMASNATDSFQKALSKIPTLDMISNSNPRITPVLDLSLVEKESSRLGEMMAAGTITPTVSRDEAYWLQRAEALTRSTSSDTTPVEVVKEVKFEQTINSPEPLSTEYIYRQTRNQIALAREELGIPA